MNLVRIFFTIVTISLFSSHLFAQKEIGKRISMFEREGKFIKDFTIQKKQRSVHKVKKYIGIEKFRLYEAYPDFVKLRVPINDNNVLLLLERIEYNPKILSGDGKLFIPSERDSMKYYFYRGTVKGIPNSIAAITISNKNGITGTIQIDSTLYEVGNDAVYNTADVEDKVSYGCSVSAADSVQDSITTLLHSPGSVVTNKMVNFLWEVRNQVFQSKGTLSATTEFILGVWNQVSTVYENDGIHIKLKTLKIWDQPDPFTGTTASQLLTSFNNFSQYYTSAQGDLYMLLGYTGGGGVAGVGGLCSPWISSKRGYCAIYSSYAVFPNYSETVCLVAHEMGHTLGSVHTHDCAWNGNNTKIDCCGDYAGYSSSSCGALFQIPKGTGTIMSYCHLNTGINFWLGFGPQPSDLIKTRMNSCTSLSNWDGVIIPPTPTENKPPTVQISAARQNDSTYYLNSLASDPENGVVRYTWTDTAVTLNSYYTASTVAKFKRSGSYKYTLTVTDDHNLTASVSTVVTVSLPGTVIPTTDSCPAPLTKCNNSSLIPSITRRSTDLIAYCTGLTNRTYLWCKNGKKTTRTVQTYLLSGLVKGDVIKVWMTGTISGSTIKCSIDKTYVMP